MSKGGMCKNPFGGCDHKEAVPGKRCPVCGKKKNVRLDRLDLEQGTTVKGEREGLVYLQVVTNEMHNYLYFCLGKNGVTPDKFLEAYNYLFVVRSNKPDTWGERQLKTQRADAKGRQRNVVVSLTDEEMKMGCFDVHYDLSGLAEVMHIDRFLLWLQEERAAILRENAPQFLGYLNELRQQELDTVPKGLQLPLWVFGTDDPLKVMVCPETFTQLASMLYIPEDIKQPPPVRKRPGTRPRKRKSCEEAAMGTPHGVPGQSADVCLSVVQAQPRRSPVQLQFYS